MFREFTLFLTLFSFFVATSCSFSQPPIQNIALQPSHPNAEVFVDGAPVGHGPTTVQMSKRTAHTVMAKCGRSAGMAQVDRSISTMGIVDLIAGAFFLVNWIGIFAPGFWRLEPPTVVVAIPDTSDCDIKVEGSPPSS